MQCKWVALRGDSPAKLPLATPSFQAFRRSVSVTPVRRVDCGGVRRRRRYTAGDAALQQSPRSPGTDMVRLASSKRAMPAASSPYSSRHGLPVFHWNALCPHWKAHCAEQHKDGRNREVLPLCRHAGYLWRHLRRSDGMGEERQSSRIRDTPSHALESAGQRIQNPFANCETSIGEDTN
jgi:hypothetical protein